MKYRKTTIFGYTLLLLLLTLLPPYENQLSAENDLITAFRRADALLKQKHYGEALILFEEILTRNPSFIRAYSGLVQCYRAVGDVQGAVIFIESLFLENPEDAVVNYGMGFSMYHQKRFDAAAKFFDKALQLDPNLAEAWNNRAAIFQFVDKDYEKARRYYTKAIVIGEAANNNRVVAIAQKNLSSLPPSKEILAPVTELLTLEDFINRFMAAVDNDNIKQMKALVLGQRENAEQTMVWLMEQSLRAHTRGSVENENAALLLAKLLARQYHESFNSDLLYSQFKNYQNLSNENKKMLVRGETLLEKGVDYQQKRLYRMALENFQEALVCFNKSQDNNRLSIVYGFLGETHHQMRNFTLAREAFQKSLTLIDGENALKRKARVLSSLGIVCFNMKDNTCALEFLNQSLDVYHKLQDQDSAEQVRKKIKIVKSALE